VPVIRSADKKSLAVVARERAHLVKKARKGTLDSADMTGGTFTLSNLGMLGAPSFTAILNPPESGILAVGAMRDCPVAIRGAVEIRPIMSLTLTYDHRVVDGAYATKFLVRVQEFLQAPCLIL
jgi:pyruvate dehydrogenase E2 component (dihydrolipoamide acetyltransferase)